jgi:hypothetical protein
MKFVTRVQTGIALGKTYNEPTTEFPYLRVANVQDGYIDLADVKTIKVPEREAAAAKLRDGDVLMNEGGDADKLGRGAIWREQVSPCLHQNHVFALRPQSVTSEWLSTWTGSVFAKAYFETRAKQSTNLASISSSRDDWWLYRRECVFQLREALRHCTDETFAELPNMVAAARTRARHRGRLVHRRTIGTPLLVKGLEFDHAVLLWEPDRLSVQGLYVAITRASKSLTIVSRSRTLIPNVT